MTDQARSTLTAFVVGDLSPATLYLAMVNQAVKEQRRFGVQEIVDASREKITGQPGVTPFEIRTVAEMCMTFPANLKDRKFDRETIVAVGEAERLFRRLGDQAGIDRSAAEKARLQARIDQSGAAEHGAPAGSAAPRSRMDELSTEIQSLLSGQQFERAMEPVAEYSDLARASGDKRAIVVSLDYQAKVLGATGDPERAAELAAEQKALLEEIQDPELAVKADLNNGLTLLQSGQFDQARALLEAVARTSRERGYAAVEGSALWGLGGIACSVESPDLAAALSFFQESVAAFKRVMDGPGMAKSMAFQAQMLAQLGRPAEALTIIGRAHQLASTLQMTQEIETLIGPVKAFVESEVRKAGIASGQPGVLAGPGGPAAGTPSLEQTRNAWAAAQYEYMKAIAEWKSLPLLKRLKTPKPQPPQL